MDFLLLNHTIALFLTAITSFVVGLMVLLKGYRKNINIAYSVWSLSAAWWAFFSSLIFIYSDNEITIILAKLVWVPVLLIAVSAAHFVNLLLKIKGRELFIKIGYYLCLIFAVLSFTDYMVPGVREIGYIKAWPEASFLVYVNFIIFIIYVAYQIYQLIKELRIAKGIKHTQVSYVFWASLLGYTGGLTNYLLALNIFTPFVNPFASYLLILYPVIIAVAIFKYRLMDISFIIKKAFFYSVGIAMVSGAIVGASFLSSWFVEKIPGLRMWMVPIFVGVAAFVVGSIFWNKSKEVEKLKYEFITIAAHKLRTPLTEVKWGVEALKEKNLKNIERDRLLKGIEAANSRTIDLTDELLLVSRAEANMHKYDLKLEDLELIAQDVIESYKNQLKQRNIKLSYNYENNLPQVSVDKTRIGSVIQMLLENAISYTKGEIKISIDVYKNNVIFHIEDNGIGISKKDQAHIFSKFYRSHEAYLSETEGTGVGLFLAKSIIKKHNGKIGVRSEGEGKGSIFWFGLPI